MTIVELVAVLVKAGYRQDRMSLAGREWVKGEVTCTLTSAAVVVTDRSNPEAKCFFSYVTTADMAAKGQL